MSVHCSRRPPGLHIVTNTANAGKHDIYNVIDYQIQLLIKKAAWVRGPVMGRAGRGAPDLRHAADAGAAG